LLFADPGFRLERKLWRVRAFAMRRADRVICISRYAADCGIRYLGLRPERIRVIYHGVTPVFRPEPRPLVGEPYFLFVSEYAEGKGFAEALRVMSVLTEAGLPHVLKVAGRVPEHRRDAVERLLAGSGCRDRVALLGYVLDEELAALYRGATALIFTSRREGFGRPPIEAMASGTPTVCFDNTSLPEIVDDAGILVPDGDTDAFADAVLRLTKDDSLRADLADRALRRARLFDWDRCAAEHAELYRSLAG
jgi:glycosyltransferase involved in cell wall biosynthesis